MSIQVARNAVATSTTAMSSTTTSMVHSMASFWQAVVDVIVLHTDQQVWPPRWTPHARYENLNLTAVQAAAFVPPPTDDLRGGDRRVHMVVLPDCHDLYEYDAFTTLLAAVEFSKPQCLHLGRHFTLTAFHPHFKNSPRFMSPERHAPFPTIGLQLVRASFGARGDADLPQWHNNRAYQQNHQQQPREQSKTTDNGKILPHPEPEPEDKEMGALADARIRNLDQTRAHFEVLFHSAAAAQTTATTDSTSTTPSFKAFGRQKHSFPSSTSEQATSKPTITSLSASSNAMMNPQLPEEEALAHSFRQERQRRRGNLPTDMVRQVIDLWMEEQRYADASKREPNPALEFMDTIQKYTVCSQKMGEMVYAEIWQCIQQVYEQGLEADTALAAESAMRINETKENISEQKKHFNLSQWMHSLSNESAAKNPNESSDDPLPKVTSHLFIVTKFNTYNAQAFKRFAITINAVLKRITDGRMFLEVFHPEYVGNQGYHHELRRSPFPMIQICYLVEAKK